MGDKVKVKVIGKGVPAHSLGIGKLAFSIKKAGKDPWEGVLDKYKKDTKLKGRVVRISDFGVFVRLDPGIEGLVHITKIPPGFSMKEGQEVNVYVEEFDSDRRKLSLGLVLTRKPVGYK